MHKKQSHNHNVEKKKKKETATLVLVFSFLLCSFWIGGLFLNAYRYPTVAAAYNLLWVPVLMCTCCLPVYLFVHLNKAKFNMKSVYWIPTLLLIATGIFVVINKYLL